MTDDEKTGRRRHVLKRSSLREADLGTTAIEPESGAVEETVVEETVEAPALDETVEAPVVEELTDDPAAEPLPADPAADEPVDGTAADGRGPGVAKAIAFVVLPVLALLLVLMVGWLKFLDVQANDLDTAREQAMQTARDSTITLLSYNPDTVDQQLTDAQALVTGQFKDEYAQLTRDVVIPGAKQQRISAVATVPRAASVSTEPDHAVVLVFVNQTVVVGDSQPTATLSSVRVTLDKIDGHWLISKFDPV